MANVALFPHRQIQRRPMSIDFVVVLCRVWLGIVTTNMAFTLFMSAHAYFAKQCRHIIDGSVKAIFTLAHSSAGSYTSPDLWMRLRLVRRVEHVINTQVMNHNVEGARDTMRQLQQAVRYFFIFWVGIGQSLTFDCAGGDMASSVAVRITVRIEPAAMRLDRDTRTVSRYWTAQTAHYMPSKAIDAFALHTHLQN